MTKLIVDMPMPKCCAKCPLSEHTTAWDQKDDKEVVGYACDLERSFLMREDDAAKARAYGCPIKGVLPEHHGDLIDRSLLCADLAGVILPHRGIGIDEVIARQPAIIAAERKDDDKQRSNIYS